MAIRVDGTEEQDTRAKRRDLVRQIEKYERGEDKLAADKKKKKDKPDAAQSTGGAEGKPNTSIRVQARDAEAAKKIEERSESTVKRAHKGQKVGEQWQAFADRTPQENRPASAEQLKRDAEKKAEEKRQNEKVISVRDLQNDLAISKKHIPG